MMTATVADAVGEVRRRIEGACGRAGRDASDVRLVGVTKGVDGSLVAEAVACGITDLGENRAQALRDRAIEGDVTWHFLGAVQTNKVRYLDGVGWIHGLCRAGEGAALQRRGELIGRAWDTCIEVNVAGEATKRGVAPSDVEPLLDALDAYPLVRVRGIMIVAPVARNPDDVRWVFAEARRVADALLIRRPVVRELSMGMTDDYEVAIEEGATMVRVGRAIFRKG